MSTTPRSRPIPSDWRDLYRDAILETNQTAACQKVCEAEAAVLSRVRELLYLGGTIEENEALEDALYLLRAYRNVQSLT